jgi:hypothetical protein
MTRKNRRRQHNSSPRPSPYDTADRRRVPYNERRILNENRRVLDDNRLVLDDNRCSGQREGEHPPGHRIDSKSRRRRDRGPPWPPKVNASTDRYTPQYQQENSRSLPRRRLGHVYMLDRAVKHCNAQVQFSDVKHR